MLCEEYVVGISDLPTESIAVSIYAESIFISVCNSIIIKNELNSLQRSKFIMQTSISVFKIQHCIQKIH